MGNGCNVRTGPACLANVRLDSGNGGCTVRSTTITGLVCCRNDYLVDTDCGHPPPQVNLSISPIAPSSGNLLTNVSIPLNYEINLDITIAAGATPATGWGSIVHFTATGNDGGSGTAVLGDRIPGIWFHPNSWSLYVIDGGDASPTATNFDNVCPLGAAGVLPTGQTTNLRVIMRPSHFRVLINGVIHCNEARTARQTWNSVMVFVGDPWYTPAPQTTISNFYMLEALPAEQEIIGSNALTPTHGTVLATNIALALNYEVGFTIVPHNVAPGWQNVFHFNADGTDWGHPGSRVPGVWLYPGSSRMHTVDGGDTSAIFNDNCDRIQPLPLNASTQVRILMFSERVLIYMNGSLVCTEPRHGRQIWPNVTVWFSDPWYPAALASVSNLYLATGSTLGPNLVQNGGFELGWSQPWRMVAANSGGLPGWQVTMGNIDYGNYNTGGHCNQTSYNANFGCAGEGEAFLDLCGNTRGAIRQTLYLEPNSVYTLSFLYESHAGCSRGHVTRMTVSLVSAAGVTFFTDSVTHVNAGSWSLNWTAYSTTFTAPSQQATLSFTSDTTGCGCMLIDGVETRKDCLLSPPPPPPCGANSLTNGGFEQGWRQPYQSLSNTTGSLPGWQVTQGVVEIGNFRQSGNCVPSCASQGAAFLQLCGAYPTQGAVSQSVSTVQGTTYVLSFTYTSHSDSRPQCSRGGTLSSATVTITGQSPTTLSHRDVPTWNLGWVNRTITFVAASSTTVIQFAATTHVCGCIMIDAVSVTAACNLIPAPPPPPCLQTNLVYDGSFEANFSQPWRVVNNGSGGLPGWTVTSGSVDYGNYHTTSACANWNCAAAGQSFLDMCGTSAGTITQNLTTTPGMLYSLSVRYEAHPRSGCATGNNQQTEVRINGQRFHLLQHQNEQSWQLNWATYSAQFQATSSTTELSFASLTSGCGCMLLDDVRVQAACVPSGSAVGIPATFCNGYVSSGSVVSNGCYSNLPTTFNPLLGSSRSCLTDGNPTRCVQGGANAMYTVQLPCRGRVTGSLIIVGGPDSPTNGTRCGGFQESGTVVSSADGQHWTPLASWSCRQGVCDVSGVSHSIDNGFGAAELTVTFDPDQDVQFVGITLGSNLTYVDEFALSPGATMQCTNSSAALQCGNRSLGDVCAAEHSVCSCDGYVAYGMGSTYTAPRRVSGTISCTNDVFGDPLPGTFKECRCASGSRPTWDICQRMSQHYLCENQGCSAAYPPLTTWQACAAAAQVIGLNDTNPCVADVCADGQRTDFTSTPCRYCTTLADMATKPAGCYYKPGNSPTYRLWFNPTHNNVSIIDPNRLALCGVSTVATTCPGTTCHQVQCGNGLNSTACANEAGIANTCVPDDTVQEIRCCADGVTPPNPQWRQRPGCSVWAQSDMADGGCSNGTFCDAANLCARNGGRLCTAAEVQGRCTRNTGCMHNFDLVWTATSQLATCTPSVITNVASMMSIRNSTNCPASWFNQLLSSGDPSWDYQSNCPCLVLAGSAAESANCKPFSSAQTSISSAYLRCLAFFSEGGVHPVQPNSSHYVVCGVGSTASSTCTGGAVELAADGEFHEVRCCSENASLGWVRQTGCSVWSESDSWSAGCQTLNFPNAEAFCQSVGGRLCTAAEVDSGCARGTGCGALRGAVFAHAFHLAKRAISSSVSDVSVSTL